MRIKDKTKLSAIIHSEVAKKKKESKEKQNKTKQNKKLQNIAW